MYKYSHAFSDPITSPIRALFKHLADPEMISFAGGYPDASLFDAEGLGEAAQRAFLDSNLCLQYGGTDGIPKLKSEIVRHMEKRGISATHDNIVVTTGSQQAFDLILRVLEMRTMWS